MAAKLREVDTRAIQGNGGTVALYMRGVDDPYEVHITDWSGEHVHTLYATTRASALEAYHHPFASLGTPNLFERETAILYVDADEDGGVEVPA